MQSNGNALFSPAWRGPSSSIYLFGLVITQRWWDIPGLLGMKLETGLLGGVVAHYANGAILAIIYAGVGPSLWGPSWVRALTYITAQTVLGVWLFMLPLLGAGMAGLKMGVLTPVMALVRHWAYGLALAWLYPLPQVVSPGQPPTSPLRGSGLGPRVASIMI